MIFKKLQFQEKLALDIAEYISIAIRSNQVYVQIVMNHRRCVSARGAKSERVTDVTYISEPLKLNIMTKNKIETKIANLRK